MGRLFPKKKDEKEQLVLKVKQRIRGLNIKRNDYTKRADINLQNVAIALKRKEKEKAKSFMIQHKILQQKSTKAQNKILKYKRYIDAIDEGISIEIDGELEKDIMKTLNKIVAKVKPEEVAMTSQEIEALVLEIEDSSDILAGDPEIDFGIDVSEDLAILEAEILLNSAQGMPEVPAGEIPIYISEDDVDEKDVGLMSREEVLKEIEKYKKELET